jgi:hypothetical protein
VGQCQRPGATQYPGGDAMPGGHIDSAVEFEARERAFGDTGGTDVGVIDAMNAEHAIALEHIAMLEEKIAQLESQNLMHKYPDNCDLIDHNLYEANARAAAAPEAAGSFAVSIPVGARLNVSLPFDLRTCASTRFEGGVLYCTMAPDATPPDGFPELHHDPREVLLHPQAAIAANHRGFWFREPGTGRVVIAFHAHIESVDNHTEGLTQYGAETWRVSGYITDNPEHRTFPWLPLHRCDMNAFNDHEIDGAQWADMIRVSGGD